jgi:hypothetical protein
MIGANAEVEIRDDGGGLCRQGPPPGLDEEIRWERFFISTASGGIAAARQFGLVGFGGTAGDYCLLGKHTAFDSSERSALWKIAEQLVERNWWAVVVIALALHREGRLNGRRIVELLQPARCGLARRRRRAA